MTDLFNKSDVLTVLTKEQAKVGDKGYFSDNLENLDANVKRGEVHSLVKIYDDDRALFPFGSDHLGSDRGNRFALFLPADKVKKEPTYRPFNCLDELFNFFFPEYIKDNFCDQTEKALFFLGKTLVLKNRYHDYIKVMTIKEVDFFNNCSGDGGSSNIELNCFTLLYLFNNYEIKKDGKFVPFGVVE